MRREDEDVDLPLPPPPLAAGASVGGDGPEPVDAGLPFPPLPPLELPEEDEEEEEELDLMATAADARLERFWNVAARGFPGSTGGQVGFRGFGLLRFAARPAKPMGLFGPAEDDNAGTLSSERLKGWEVSGGGVSGLLGGVSSRGTPNGALEGGLGGLMAMTNFAVRRAGEFPLTIFFMFFVHRAQYQTRRGSLTS